MPDYFPKITIITPSFNQGSFLEKCILSVINQNYENLEYIVIDGGSSDKSVEIIQKYGHRISYWISESDDGTYDANNKALKLMTGEYWCVVNSDDYLLPGALQLIAKEIRECKNEMWICGGDHVVDENDEIILKRKPKMPASVEGFTFLQSSWISHPAVFLHKDIVKKVGLFRPTHVMDWDYWLNIERLGYSPHIVDEYLAGYRIHKDSKSANKIKLQKEILKTFSSFVNENNLQTNKLVMGILRNCEMELYRFQLTQELINKNWVAFYLSLIKITVKQPSAIFTKWYLGIFKRFLLGFSPNDPLLNDFKNFESKANWDN